MVFSLIDPFQNKICFTSALKQASSSTTTGLPFKYCPISFPGLFPLTVPTHSGSHETKCVLFIKAIAEASLKLMVACKLVNQKLWVRFCNLYFSSTGCYILYFVTVAGFFPCSEYITAFFTLLSPFPQNICT